MTQRTLLGQVGPSRSSIKEWHRKKVINLLLFATKQFMLFAFCIAQVINASDSSLGVGLARFQGLAFSYLPRADLDLDPAEVGGVL